MGDPASTGSSARSTSGPFRVVIAGGGVAGIEAALALRHLAGERVELVMATDASEFVYRPLAVVRPFQGRPTFRLALTGIAEDLGATLVPHAAAAVEADRRRLVLDGGARLDYDALLVAIGARAEAVLAGGTLTPWDWGEGHAFRSMLANLATEAGDRRIAFIVPPGLTWPLPLYELALLTDSFLRERAIDGVSLTIVSAEREPLEDFGPRVSAAVADLLEARGIAAEMERESIAVADGAVRTAQGRAVRADVTVALPVIVARPLSGLPANDAGFVAVDARCRALGATDVFAAGDCTNLPLKQGGIAARQADVAAAGIAALAGVPVETAPFAPELEAVLLTGETPLHLDPSGVRPILRDDELSDRERREKVFARHLTAYLEQTMPPLPFFDASDPLTREHRAEQENV